MISISLCMIVKNEEDVLERCLNSVKGLVDEIIIVDTGSTDRTKETAARFTTRLFDFFWIDDFSAARNFSFSKSTMDYRMWLDADDVITEQDRTAFQELKQSLSSDTDVVMLPYHTAFDTNGEPVFTYYRERIIRSCDWLNWSGAIHEAISPMGNIHYGTAAVTHQKSHPGDVDRNLRIFEKMLTEHKTFSPRDQFYYGRELYYHNRFEDSASILETFLEEGAGWIENNIEACKFLAYCYESLKLPEKIPDALLKSLRYDSPRAEICCELGKHFLALTQYKVAAFWYEEALKKDRDDTSGAFVIPDCYGYLPCIQLCVCYDGMGDREKAIYFNERAGTYKPKDEAYLYNKNYYTSLDH